MKLLGLVLCIVVAGTAWLHFSASVENTPSRPITAESLRHEAHTVESVGDILSALIDPKKLATLKGDRAANRRLRIVVYWLETAKRASLEPAEVLEFAQRKTGYFGSPRASEDTAALLRNRTILERLGCLDGDGMENLRVGRAPTVKRGPYAGEIASVDHIIPRSVTPELDEALFNLEFMPASLNRRKAALVGDRQRALANIWRRMGLLSNGGLEAVLKSPVPNSAGEKRADH